MDNHGASLRLYWEAYAIVYLESRVSLLVRGVLFVLDEFDVSALRFMITDALHRETRSEKPHKRITRDISTL